MQSRKSFRSGSNDLEAICKHVNQLRSRILSLEQSLRGLQDTMDITIAKILVAINDSQGFMGMIVVVTEFHEHGKTTNGKFLNRNVQKYSHFKQISCTL